MSKEKRRMINVIIMKIKVILIKTGIMLAQTRKYYKNYYNKEEPGQFL